MNITLEEFKAGIEKEQTRRDNERKKQAHAEYIAYKYYIHNRTVQQRKRGPRCN